MDGLHYNGKPYEQMDDLGVKNPLFLVQHPYLTQESECFEIHMDANILTGPEYQAVRPVKTKLSGPCQQPMTAWWLSSLTNPSEKYVHPVK